MRHKRNASPTTRLYIMIWFLKLNPNWRDAFVPVECSCAAKSWKHIAGQMPNEYTNRQEAQAKLFHAAPPPCHKPHASNTPCIKARWAMCLINERLSVLKCGQHSSKNPYQLAALNLYNSKAEFHWKVETSGYDTGRWQEEWEACCKAAKIAC